MPLLLAIANFGFGGVSDHTSLLAYIYLYISARLHVQVKFIV